MSPNISHQGAKIATPRRIRPLSGGCRDRMGPSEPSGSRRKNEKIPSRSSRLGERTATFGMSRSSPVDEVSTSSALWNHSLRFPEFFQLASSTPHRPTVQWRSVEKHWKLPGIFRKKGPSCGRSRQFFPQVKIEMVTDRVRGGRRWHDRAPWTSHQMPGHAVWRTGAASGRTAIGARGEPPAGNAARPGPRYP